MFKKLTTGTKIFKLEVCSSDQGLDEFHSYSVLNHIIVKNVLNFMKISFMLNYINAKSAEKSEITNICVLVLGEDLSR